MLLPVFASDKCNASFIVQRKKGELAEDCYFPSRRCLNVIYEDVK